MGGAGGARFQVSGVPHFVIGRYSFSGAQDVPTMKKVLAEGLLPLSKQ